MKSVCFAVFAVLVMLAPGLAQARPRDDVMSGAFRCAAIGDSRTWLDCYYGAAQPARAQLGLAPAPAAQLRLAQSPPSGTPADGGVRNAVMGAAFGCNAVADDRQWLDCYYGAAQPMRTQLGLSPAPQARLAPPPVPAASLPVPPAGGMGLAVRPPPNDGRVPEGQFGLSVSKTPTNEKVDHVVSRMSAYSFDHYGIFTVTLANGQVWRQLSGDTDYAHWKKPAGTYVVNITRGWFGSFNFEVKGNPGMFKVQREK